MSEDKNKPKIRMIGEGDDDMSNVAELSRMGNLTSLLKQYVGDKWLLVYKNAEGSPCMINNPDLEIEEQVFLAEIAKHITLQFLAYTPEDF